ncbi:uncharacterized protein [Haliotis cracherodii]|uniref:uncharacterized protein n=1 Tax=Haliotis cracherodii TaxID=6455 RepID=UPI0039E92D7A
MAYVHALLAVLLTASSYVNAQNACSVRRDAACVAAVRSLYTNTSAFWFGTRYATDCPPDSGSPVCTNNSPSRTSLLTRLMGDGATDSSGLAFVLNVTYPITLPADGSDRIYNGCGRIVKAPLTRPQHFVVDPLANTVYPPYDLREEPEVTWPAEENTLYTVIMFDPAPFYVHALYVNVAGGRLQNGDTIFPYFGPGNPVDRDNPYVWLVFKQQRALNASLIPRVRIPVYVEDLVSQLGLSTQSYGISVVMTNTDEFTAVFIRSVNFMNRCPVFYGQWLSSYIQKRGGLPSLPARLDLSVSVDVSFTAPAITYKSCGLVYEGSPVNVTVDYRNMDLLRTVETRNSPQVSLVPLVTRGQPPSVTVKDKQYTLMMLDINPELGKTEQNSIIHWMVVNIRGTDISTGEEVYDWVMPLTPTLNRLYLFALFEQTAHVSTATARSYVGANCPSFMVFRCNFRAGDYIRDNNLSLVGLRHLRVIPDTYQQYMSYAVFKFNTMAQSCWGRTENAPPCSSSQKIIVE